MGRLRASNRFTITKVTIKTSSSVVNNMDAAEVAKRRDRAAGAIMGVLIGDALGLGAPYVRVYGIKCMACMDQHLAHIAPCSTRPRWQHLMTAASPLCISNRLLDSLCC